MIIMIAGIITIIKRKVSMSFAQKKFICVFLSFCFVVLLNFLTSCTYSITMVHTEGSASDVVDEEQTAQPDISPNLSIPASLVP